jgi:hypothetical protein
VRHLCNTIVAPYLIALRLYIKLTDRHMKSEWKQCWHESMPLCGLERKRSQNPASFRSDGIGVKRYRAVSVTSARILIDVGFNNRKHK